MKRWIALAVALWLACGTALAEGEVFTFRNGVVWGMTQDEVLFAEDNPDYEADSLPGGRMKLELEELRVAGVEAELEYLFVNGALAAARYAFDGEDVDFDVIREALSQKYGAPGSGDTDRFQPLIGAALGLSDLPVPAPSNGDLFLDWALADGTYIAMTNLSPDDGYDRDDLYVYYFDEAAILAAGDASLSEPAPALDW